MSVRSTHSVAELPEPVGERVGVIDRVEKRVQDVRVTLGEVGVAVERPVGHIVLQLVGSGVEIVVGDRSELLAAVRTRPPVVPKQLSTRSAEIGGQRLGWLGVFVPESFFRGLDVVGFDDVAVDVLKRRGPLHVAKQHPNRVRIEAVVAVHDCREIVSEVVRVHGFFDLSDLLEAVELVPSRVLGPVISLFSLPVARGSHEEVRIIVAAVGVILDPVANVLRRAEHRTATTTIEGPLQSPELGSVVVVEVDIPLLEIDIADPEGQQSGQALTSEDQQLQQRPVPRCKLGAAARPTERIDVVLGEEVSRVVRRLGFLRKHRDFVGLNLEIVVLVEEFCSSLIVADGGLGEASILVQGVHEVIHFFGSGIEQVETLLGRDTEVRDISISRSERVGFGLPVLVVDYRSALGVVKSVGKLEERVTAGVSNSAPFNQFCDPLALLVEHLFGSDCHSDTSSVLGEVQESYGTGTEVRTTGTERCGHSITRRPSSSSHRKLLGGLGPVGRGVPDPTSRGNSRVNQHLRYTFGSQPRQCQAATGTNHGSQQRPAGSELDEERLGARAVRGNGFITPTRDESGSKVGTHHEQEPEGEISGFWMAVGLSVSGSASRASVSRSAGRGSLIGRCTPHSTRRAGGIA